MTKNITIYQKLLCSNFRLRHLAQKQYELSNGIDTEHAKISSEHLDHGNPHTFEIEDLKKLIAKVSADLNEADEKRRKEFKEYEMQKEYEKQQKLKHLEGSEREAFEKQLKENETKHKQHERVGHLFCSKQCFDEFYTSSISSLSHCILMNLMKQSCNFNKKYH